MASGNLTGFGSVSRHATAAVADDGDDGFLDVVAGDGGGEGEAEADAEASAGRVGVPVAPSVASVGEPDEAGAGVETLIAGPTVGMAPGAAVQPAARRPASTMPRKCLRPTAPSPYSRQNLRPYEDAGATAPD